MTDTELLPTATKPAQHRAQIVQTSSLRQLIGEQASVVVGQGLAGIGNMVFLLVAARGLARDQFAQLATFLALYLLLIVPTAGLAAAAAANPDAPIVRRRARLAIAAVTVAVVTAAVPLANLAHLDAPLTALLGLSIPSVTALAIARGRLYGRGRRGTAVLTLLVEPTMRLGPGVFLLHLAGPVGAAAAVVVGGYLALLLAVSGNTRPAQRGSAEATPSDGARSLTVKTFIGLSLLQNLDLILANRLLEHGAGTFAAISTLGGIAAFATATLPLVLLPRARRGSHDAGRATWVAIGTAAVIGGLLVVVSAIAPPAAYTALLGNRYGHVGRIAVLYLAAMALFGVSRVLAARLCMRGAGRAVATVIATALTVQVGSIVALARTAEGVAGATEAAMGVLTVGMVGVHVLSERGTQRRARPHRTTRHARRRRLRDQPDLWLLVGLTAAAVLVRVLITRGLWVDEATSVYQARMPYDAMLHNLQTTDVHPPGYFTVLWAWVRMFGHGELAVRVPSIIFGALLIPAIYGAARELFDRRAARLAATFAVLAPQAVWYSQEARMYSLFMLLVVLAVWAQARAIRLNSPLSWASYSLVSAALVYTQYFTTLVIAAQQLVFLAVVIHRRRRRIPVRRTLLSWFMAAVVAALLIAPLVPFAMHQFQVNQAAGKGFGAPTNTGVGASLAASGPSVYSLIANLLWGTVGYHSDSTMTVLGSLWPLAMLLSLALLGRGRSRAAATLLVVGLFPVLALFVVGQEKSFVFDLRYFIGVVPLLVILAARAATSWPKRRGGRVIMAVVTLAALSVGLVDQQVNGNNPRRYDFAPALHTIAAHAGPLDQVVLTPDFLNTVSVYYEPQLHYVLDKSTAGTVTKVAHAHRVFVLASFAKTGDVGAQQSNLLAHLERHRRVIARWSFDNVKVWELT